MSDSFSLPPLLPLPTDWPRNTQSCVAAAWACPYPSGRIAAIPLQWLAAWIIVLNRLTQESAFALGIKTDDGIGILPIRLADEMSYQRVIHQLADELKIAMSHTFIDSVTATPIPNTHPVFQVAFAYADTVANSEQLTALSWPNAPLLDLALTLTPTTLQFSYRADLFQLDTIQRIADQLQQVLTAALSQPQRPLASLSLLSSTERQQVLSDWNQTDTPLPDPIGVQYQFERYAAQQPAAIAVTFDTEQLSYQALNQQANALAHHLRRLGVGLETRVAICLPRSLAMVVAVLATVKAGGAYVPLDPDYPPARLAFMLDDSAAAVLLTVSSQLPQLPPTQAQRVCLDQPTWPLDAVDNLPPLSGADHLIYVIYTSGTTGQPKGVLVEHRGVCNAIASDQRIFGLQPGQRILHFFSLSFDASSSQLWMALANGATLCVATPANLLHILQSQAVTQAGFTPSLLAALPDSLELPALKTVTVGAEPCPQALVQRWVKGGRRFFNLYGPTEASIYATYEQCSGETTPTLGRPIQNARCYVLDEYLQPVPIGVTGELYIGGVGVARGYLNRPELTAERFLANPFIAGERLYQTGDLARWLADGRLVFAGRLDEQVKVRGFRVELSELTAVLKQVAGVQAAAVVLRQPERQPPFLAAYLVPQPQAPADLLDQVQQHASTQLPPHAVPAAWMLLDQLPLTPNGKLDQSALPVPPLPAVSAAHTPPRTSLEQWLADCWQRVLLCPPPSVFEPFFNLGGDSIKATLIINQLQAQLGCELSLSSVLNQPTIAALASYLQHHHPAALQDWTLPVRPVTSPLPCLDRSQLAQGQALRCALSYAQQQLWLLMQLQPDNPFYNIPVACELRGPLDYNLLQSCFVHLSQRHEALRTCFNAEQGEPLQIIVPSVAVTVPVLSLPWPSDQAVAEHHELQRQLSQYCAQPFVLEQAPLWRLQLWQLDTERHLLLIVLHHLITDGWSIGLLQREWSQLYADLQQQQPPRLSPLPVQYADFAHWQRHQLNSAAAQQQVTFWQDYLSGAPPLFKLPLDYPRPPVQRYRGAQQRFNIDRRVTQALKQCSQAHEATLFMLLLAAFKVLLYRYQGATDSLVGTPVANRNRAELEGVMGFFINTLVLRTDLSGNPPFLTVLQRVRETALNAYAHQSVPFERVVEAVQPPRALNHSPIFQVLFVLQNMPMPSLNAHGLQIQPLDIEEWSSKFDLNLHVTELDDGGLHGKLYYNCELFRPQTIAWLLGHFQYLLQRIIAAPNTPIDALALMPPQLLHTPDLPPPWPEFPQQSIMAAISHRAQQQPTALALSVGEVQWDYATLLQHAARCAALLQAAAYPIGARVAVLSGPAPAVISALLGSLWAGYVVVPLDDYWPPARLAQIVTDAGACCLLSPSEQHELAATVATATERPLHLITLPLQPVAEFQPPPLAPSHLAYLIYTSGSTGRAKAVAQTHGNALHFIQAYCERLNIQPTDRWLFSSSYGVDNWVLDILGALFSGAAVVPYAVREQGLLQLPPFIAAQSVTVFHNTPTVFDQLLDLLADDERLSDSLRLIVLGGEPVSRRTFLGYQHHTPPTCKLYNGYGLTEASSVLGGMFDHEFNCTHALLPMGQVQPGMAVRLVNAAGTETQVYGEIRLESAYLAPGYWQRPELTAQRFQRDPANPQRWWYRTGDLARRSADGHLYYLGRVDFQLKWHGFRVEPAEIEMVLTRHPAIQTALVTLWQATASAEPQLVAYLVLKHTPPAHFRADLQRHLRATLPESMIPSRFVLLEHTALTASGKLNRHALPSPDAIREPTDEAAALTAPRTALESALVVLWQKVLQKEPIGIHDNFFDLGGHSLLALKLLARIEQQFQQQLSLMTLFQAPTVAELATVLSTQGCAVTGQALQVVQPQGHKPPLFFMTSLLRAQILAKQLTTEQPLYGINIFAFQAETPLTLPAIVQRYADELQQVQPAGPYYLLGYCADARIALALAHELRQRGQTVAFLGFIDFGQWRRKRWQRHWQNAQLFGFWPYFQHKLFNRFHLGYLLKRLTLRLLRTIRGQKLPTHYQTLQFIQEFEHARNAWPLRPWPGKVDFFLSEEMVHEHTPQFADLGQVCEVHTVPGFHLSLFQAPYVDRLGQEISASLSKTTSF